MYIGITFIPREKQKKVLMGMLYLEEVWRTILKQRFIKQC
jgi:hypothetical protein